LDKKVFDGLKILLVEEEALIAMDIEQLCYDLGAATVATISSRAKLSQEALDSVGARAQMLGTDVAILDAKVGGEWTADLARRLTGLKIPFVFATGYSGGEAFFEEFPDVPVVLKPYAGEQLIGAILTAIERTRLEHGG